MRNHDRGTRAGPSVWIPYCHRATSHGRCPATVALVMFAVHMIAAEPRTGLVSVIGVVGMRLLTIAPGEWMVRRPALPGPLQPVRTVTRPVQRRGMRMNIDKAGSQGAGRDDGDAERGSNRSCR